MNKVYCFTNWGIVIASFIICAGMMSIFLVLDIKWMLIPSTILFLFSFWGISNISLCEDSVVITYPFRFFKKKCDICYSEIQSILFHVMASKASSEYLVFYMKDGTHKKIMLDINNISLEFLLFFQTKGINIEVKGTENNSIKDLCHTRLTGIHNKYFAICLQCVLLFVYVLLLFLYIRKSSL